MVNGKQHQVPSEWIRSLSEYGYPVNLGDFQDAEVYPRWFGLIMPVGDRAATIEFETRFRTHAAEATESWLEVVYWKLYSQPTARRNNTTRRLAAHFRQQATTPQALFDTCNRYIDRPSRRNLESICDMLGLTTSSIAVAATFPAFLRPDLFPMVDTRVAKWVGCCMQQHNAEDLHGPQLIRPPYLDSGRTVLTLSDFPFVESWILWCRYTARKLTKLTESVWRPRYVEMAVFNAWGRRHDEHPKLELETLAAR